MDELVSELEAAIADAGALVVRLQKYRRGAEPEGAALLREALALGDAARRLHHRGALDARAATRLLADARGLGQRLHTLCATVRAEPAYRAAVAAVEAGDGGALARLLPAVFAGLEPVAAPVDLFHPLAWLRRGRPRPVDDVVADVMEARDPGLAGAGDDLSPGADPELPAVVLQPAAPADEPLALRFPAGALAAPLHLLVETGEHLAHARRLRAAFAVRIADVFESPEQLRAELGPTDYAEYRRALAAALVGAGLTVEIV